MSLAFPQSPQLDEVFVAGDRAWKWNGYAWDRIDATTGIHPYVVACFADGTLGDGEVLLEHPAVVSVQFPANLAGSKAFAAAGPQQDADLLVDLSGTIVGTIRFLTGNGEATFLPSDAFTFSPAEGHILTLFAPSPADPWLERVSISLKGFRA